jgi:hypothetical protein
MVSDDPESFADLDGHVTNASQDLSAPAVPACASSANSQTTVADVGFSASYDPKDLHSS